MADAVKAPAKATLPKEVFAVDVKNHELLKLAYDAYLANNRTSAARTKTRGEISGGGKKPWRQKGTGRARAGTIRSPIWRSGGVTFAATPRDYSQKVNRKMYRGAMRCILSELVRQDRLVVVEGFDLESPKTKLMAARLKELNAEGALVVAGEVSENVYLASRNLPKVAVCDVQAIDPVSLIAHEKVVVTVDALKKLEELLA